MNRQNSNFKQEFSKNFLNAPKYISNADAYLKCKPGISVDNYDCDALHERMYTHHNPSDGSYQGGSREAYNYSNGFNQDGSQEAYNKQKPNEQYPRRFNQNAPGGAFNASSEHHNHHRQRQQLGHDRSIRHTSSYLAGGDGNIQDVRNQQIADAKDVRSNYMQPVRQEETQSSGATYNKRSNSSSRFSNSSKETAVERPVGRRGKQLLNLTISKANLLKTVKEGISDLQQKHYSSNQKPADLGRPTSTETFNCESESSNACSSPSAVVINNKIIHPMVKKFRVLYLNNIREEVGMLQELETLPHKLNKLCKKLENKE